MVTIKRLAPLRRGCAEAAGPGGAPSNMQASYRKMAAPTGAGPPRPGMARVGAGLQIVV